MNAALQPMPRVRSAETAPSSQAEAIPTLLSEDSDDVALALETSAALWRKGETKDAIRWLRRAAEAAEEAGDDRRALALARCAADLSEAAARAEEETRCEERRREEPAPPAPVARFPEPKSRPRLVGAALAPKQASVAPQAPKAPVQASNISATSSVTPRSASRAPTNTPAPNTLPSAVPTVRPPISAKPRPVAAGSMQPVPAKPSSVFPRPPVSQSALRGAAPQTAPSRAAPPPAPSSKLSSAIPPAPRTPNVALTPASYAPAAKSSSSQRGAASERPAAHTSDKKLLSPTALTSLRVAILAAPTEDGQFVFRVLGEGETAPSGYRNALIVVSDPVADALFERR
jgi:hypothetical protein